MKQKRTPKIRTKSIVIKSEVPELDSELKAINRILDKRYEMLVELS